MAKLDVEDWDRMDKSFKRVYDRVEEVQESVNISKEQLTEKIGDVRRAQEVHEATPCKDVIAHEEKKHNIAKAVAIVAGILVAASTAAAVISRLVSASSLAP